VPAEVRLYDRLFSIEDPGSEEEFLNYLNPASLTVLTTCYAEQSLKNAEPGSPYQFERLGYFNVDLDAQADKPVFNRIVPLRDSWTKIAREKRKNIKTTRILRRLKVWPGQNSSWAIWTKPFNFLNDPIRRVFFAECPFSQPLMAAIRRPIRFLRRVRHFMIKESHHEKVNDDDCQCYFSAAGVFFSGKVISGTAVQKKFPSSPIRNLLRRPPFMASMKSMTDRGFFITFRKATLF